MERKEFLALVGLSAGALTLSLCSIGCKKEEEDQKLTKDFTIDLSQSQFSMLNTNGGFIVTNEVIVARTNAGTYIAVAAACTHEGTSINYEANANRFKCPNHGATFSNSGAVTNGPAAKSLQQFNTSLSGTILRVFS